MHLWVRLNSEPVYVFSYKLPLNLQILVNFLSINYGIAAGWVAPNLPRFQTEDSPIGMITSSEAAFIVSSMCIGGLVGSLIFGILCDLLGRKWTLVCSAIPQIIGNLLVVFGTNTYYIYASRLLFGFAGGAVFTVLPIFVSEISRERFEDHDLLKFPLTTTFAFF